MKKLLLMALLLPVGSAFGMQEALASNKRYREDIQNLRFTFTSTASNWIKQATVAPREGVTEEARLNQENENLKRMHDNAAFFRKSLNSTRTGMTFQSILAGLVVGKAVALATGSSEAGLKCGAVTTGLGVAIASTVGH